MSDFIYRYPSLYPGTLVKRYKRFFADVKLDSGEVVTAHCPNTGPMKGVYIPGNRVQLSKSDNPKRKLAYTWEIIQLNDNEPTWVGVNTGLPNKIVKIALQKYIFPELGNYHEVKSEVVYGQDRKSRVDFYLPPSKQKINSSNNSSNQISLFQGVEETTSNSVATKNQILRNNDNRAIYVEVKNTTWTDKRLALFPDTETTRGQKLIQELMSLLPENRGVMLYFINRSDCTHFSPGDEADPIYGKLLRQAVSMGLEVLPCRFETTPEGVKYLELAELQL